MIKNLHKCIKFIYFKEKQQKKGNRKTAALQVPFCFDKIYNFNFKSLFLVAADFLKTPIQNLKKSLRP